MKYILSLILASMCFSGTNSFGSSIEDEAIKYQKCMRLAQNKPAEALVYVQNWIFSPTGGVVGNVPAGHCKASSLLALGRTSEAAELFEKLVNDMVVEGTSGSLSSLNAVPLTAQLYMQAALAWKDAGNFDKSYVDFSAALSSLPHEENQEKTEGDIPDGNRIMFYELYLERGTVQILRREYQAAIEDITLALEQDDGQAEAFLQRAKAFRKKKAYLEARLDLKIASKLVKDKPDNVLESGILLERGILFREQGKKIRAKNEWQEILDKYPDSDYANLAKKNIDLLIVE